MDQSEEYAKAVQDLLAKAREAMDGVSELIARRQAELADIPGMIAAFTKANNRVMLFTTTARLLTLLVELETLAARQQSIPAMVLKNALSNTSDPEPFRQYVLTMREGIHRSQTQIAGLESLCDAHTRTLDTALIDFRNQLTEQERAGSEIELRIARIAAGAGTR